LQFERCRGGLARFDVVEATAARFAGVAHEHANRRRSIVDGSVASINWRTSIVDHPSAAAAIDENARAVGRDHRFDTGATLGTAFARLANS
jgi:hypothetical protein